MERTFAVILTQLRKESGQSQKDAATALGISQALLSHYEKGIRECGLSFIIRASEYYGVTCDYLLGRSSCKHGFDEGFFAVGDIPEDKQLTTMTLFRVFSVLRQKMTNNCEIYGDRFNYFVALNMYRVLIAAVNAGEIPKNWLGGKTPNENKMYTEMIHAISNVMIDLEKGEMFENEKDPPLCIKTLVEETEAFISAETSAVI